MQILKKYVSFFTSVILSIGLVSATAVYANTSLNLMINHVPVAGSSQGIIINNSTLVPIRIISETLGANVEWNNQTKQVQVTSQDTRIEMTIGNPKVKVNDTPQVIPTAPIIHKGATMLPLRFVGEALNCQVTWDKETKTVSVIQNNLVQGSAPDFNEDSFGRLVKTTNLPNNASIFPYTAAEVPNWIYEKINLLAPALTAQTKVKHLPKDLFKSNYPYDKVVATLNYHFDTVLNVDYKTIDRELFKSYIRQVFYDNSFNASGYSNMEWADAYVDYIISNKIVTQGSALVLPEMFWTNELGQTIVSAWVKLEVTQQEMVNPSVVFQDFGAFPPSSKPLPPSETGKEYEGLVQFRLVGYEIDYNTNSIISQIHPESNGFGGALKRHK